MWVLRCVALGVRSLTVNLWTRTVGLSWCILEILELTVYTQDVGQ